MFRSTQCQFPAGIVQRLVDGLGIDTIEKDVVEVYETVGKLTAGADAPLFAPRHAAEVVHTVVSMGSERDGESQEQFF